MAERLRFETLLSELSAAFVNVPAAKVDGEIERWLRRLVEFLGVDRGTLAQFDKEAGDFLVTHSWARPSWSPVPQVIRGESVPWVRARVLAGEVVVIPRWNDVPPEAHRDRETSLRVGAKATIFIPLSVAGSVIGAVVFDSPRERSWSESLVKRARLVGEIFANALMRKRAQEQIDELLGFEDLVSQLSATFINLPVEGIAQEIEKGLQRSAELLRMDRATIYEFSGGEDVLSSTYRYAAPEVPASPAVLRRETLPWFFEHLLRGEAVAMAAPADLAANAPDVRRYVQEQGIRSSIAVPLHAGGAVRGFVGWAATRAGREWPEALVQRLRLVGEIFANALERKRAEQTLRKRTEQIIRHQAVLLELARMDNSDLLAAQKRITEEVAKTLGIERVSIWSFNEDRSEIACQDLYRLSRNAHESGLRLQARQYPRYFQALEENRAVAADDAQSDPRTNEFTEGYLKPCEITSMMDVPVWLHGKVVGIVCHEHTGPIREWKPEEQEFAASIADMVSLTLEAAERKRAEEALRESEATARAFLETAAEGIVIVNYSGRIVLANAEIEQMFGYHRNELVGQSVEVLLPKRVRAAHVEHRAAYFADPRVRPMGVGLDLTGRRRDGTEFPIEISLSYVDSQDGTLAMAFITDIAERKRAEEALRDLTGRLIAAQEEERRRIARELHDDFTQRLAVMAIEIGRLEQELGLSADPMVEGLRRMKEQIVKLSADVHQISRQLHPSILDDLGLVNAIEAECTSFANREGIRVRYEPRKVPDAIPKDVALCLYRITQESLRNICKHAQTTEAYVILAGSEGGIILSVEDCGIGFDPEQVRGKPGLGLASMKERVRLIRGEVSVESRPGQGTTIEVRVPLTGGKT